MRRWFAAFVVLLFVAPFVLVGGLYWQLSHPSSPPLPLPEGSVALEAAQDRLDGAAAADLSALQGAFQTQEKGTWCGVASAVTVLNARGGELTQEAFFTEKTEPVRSWTQITFGGMPLDALADLLEVHGAEVDIAHAGASDIAQFRAEVTRNLASEGDWLVVNYDRAVAGEEGSGHISPLGAYDPDTDSVLLLDTASYKYPPHWVPLERLFAAMDTRDPESGRSRGWVTVR